KDQVYAQNEMLAYQQKESTARVASIMENTNLSKQQQVSEIMRQMLTQAQTAGQYFTNDQIKEMTRKVSAEVDLVHQQTQNQRYGSSHIGATAKDISNVVTDAASTHVFFCVSKNVSVSCAYTQGKREQFSGFNRTLDAINNVFRKFSAFHDETGRLNVDGMNIISNDGSNKLNRSRKARVSYKVQRTINASLNAATSTRAVSSNPNFVTRQKIEIIFG